MNVNKVKDTIEETDWKSVAWKAAVLFGVLAMVLWPIAGVAII